MGMSSLLRSRSTRAPGSEQAFALELLSRGLRKQGLWLRPAWECVNTKPRSCVDWRATTYLPTCLLRKAFNLAVQGLVMLSEGEMYCWALGGEDMLGWEARKGLGLVGVLGVFHLGLQHLAMVLQALDVGLGCRVLGLGHGSIDVLVGEDLGRHCVVCDLVGGRI